MNLVPFQTIGVINLDPTILLKSMEEIKALREFREDVARYCYTRDMIEKLPVHQSTYSSILCFVVLTLADLGFTYPPQTIEFMTEEFCQKWSEENLTGQVIDLCRGADGPHLRRFYFNNEQPEQELLFVAMGGIIGRGNDSYIFCLGNFPLPDDPRPHAIHDGPTIIEGVAVWPKRRWSLGTKFVFRLESL